MFPFPNITQSGKEIFENAIERLRNSKNENFNVENKLVLFTCARAFCFLLITLFVLVLIQNLNKLAFLVFFFFLIN